VVLKLSEGLWELIHASLKWEARDNFRAKVAYFLMRRAMRRLEKRMDYSEYGGAPLLGINGNCVICHGASNGKAIMNAIGPESLAGAKERRCRRNRQSDARHAAPEGYSQPAEGRAGHDSPKRF
jgi:fatty acid/phospholipid biosynthesis enzyme